MTTEAYRQSRQEASAQFLARLAQMSPAERLYASRQGHFTHTQRLLWVTHYPEEAPIVNGEFEWIALSLADLD